MNGLDMNEKAFKCLSLKEQNTVLFNNVVEIRNNLRSYKTFKRIVTMVGTAIIGGVAFLFKLHL